MSRTYRDGIRHKSWVDDFDTTRDGVLRPEPPLKKRTKSNRGWASEGIRTPKSKKAFKKSRKRHDRRKEDDYYGV